MAPSPLQSFIPPGIGHNGGPPLDSVGTFRAYAWKRAAARSWRKVPHPVMMRRLKLATAAGLTYREYTLEILERGHYLYPDQDAERIAEIKAARDRHD